MVTVDLPVMGVRERDLRSGHQMAAAASVASAVAAGASGPMTPRDFAGLIDPELRGRTSNGSRPRARCP